ncbi:MAG: hypothetical protein WD360_07760 [Nitriliruptoraceae bacterium]
MSLDATHQHDGHPPDIVVLDSITHLDASHQGSVAIAASHGGGYTAKVAISVGLRGLIASDAGVGRDQAGIAVLVLADDVGLAAATLDYRSSRIGQGKDCAEHGIVSFVNDAARRLDCAPGDTAYDTARRMMHATAVAPQQVSLAEARFAITDPKAPIPVWGIDSASLAVETDRGAILVTGSHGALLGDRPETALKADAYAAVFNDAGAGPDGRGRSRLAALDDRQIAAVTVSAHSAVIGSAASSYADGVISHVNRRATAYGAVVGMPAKTFIDLLLNAAAVRSPMKPTTADLDGNVL